MLFNSILLLCFCVIIKINYTFCFFKKSKATLDNYIIDLLFTNSLLIIRCSPYERQILRDITIEKIGYLKCSNRDSFLPEDHVKSITILQWRNTSIKCDKKKAILKEERTYLYIKHLAKNAFKKVSLALTRVDSSGASKLHMDEKTDELYFDHPIRQIPISDTEEKNKTFTTEIFIFKNRPILCRERRFSTEKPCPVTNQSITFSYICYYKLGVVEPPTIADMDKELKTLPDDINLDDDANIDIYSDKTPEKKESGNLFFIGGGIIIILIVIVIVGIIIYYCSSGSRKSKKNMHGGSETSIRSNIS